MIELVGLEGCSVSLLGDAYENCFLLPQGAPYPSRESFGSRYPAIRDLSVSEGEGYFLLDLKTEGPLTDEERAELCHSLSPLRCFYFEPVLPTRALDGRTLPFRTASELLTYNQGKNLELWELAALYESLRGNTTKEQVFAQMEQLADLMSQAVENGLSGTVYEDRILHAQANRLKADEAGSRLVPGGVMNQVIRAITAIMETKSSMGVIVAAPTAGSCGCLPGTLLGLSKALDLPRKETVKGLLAAGLIGVFFAEGATFAAEVGGCQMECGAGSGMAAAGVAQMMGGTAEECLNAASVALQGLTGLACDPVANRVEVPCLNKNIVGGMNALSSTNMVLSGFDPVIPLDETIAAMYDIGQKLPLELRCTFGGLGKTKTSLALRRSLEQRQKK